MSRPRSSRAREFSRLRGGLLLLLLSMAVASAACGKKGPPLPPLGKRPAAPGEVRARQQGNELLLEVSIPALRNDGSPLPSTSALILLRSEPGTMPEPLERFEADRVGAEPGGTARVSVPLDLLFDGLTGPRAVIQVQLEGDRGRRSDLSEPLPLTREEPPRPPVDVAIVDEPRGVRITWEAPGPAAEPLHYNVYRRGAAETDWGEPRNEEPIAATVFLDEDVSYGSIYAYRIRSVIPGSLPPRESDATPVVEQERLDRFPPSAPTDVRALAGPEGIRVFWFPPPDEDLAACRVYRSAGAGPPRRIAEVPSDVPYFLDDDVEPGTTYTYSVTAIDRVEPPNESAPSEPATERVPRPASAAEEAPAPDPGGGPGPAA